MTTKQHGGTRANAGRKKSQGFIKQVSVRFRNQVEKNSFMSLTPRERALLIRGAITNCTACQKVIIKSLAAHHDKGKYTCLLCYID